MKAAVLVFGILSLFSFVLYFYSANHAPYTYIDVIFWGPLCSFIGIVISIITRKTRKMHPALWISGIISCMLGYLDEIPVCTGYEIDGEVTTQFPVTCKLEKAKPVLTTLPGWKCDIRGIRTYEELPENCRKYIEFIEQQIGYPITMVSNGPSRDDIIYRKSPLKK